ncbi:hypothetical protein NLJ89_g8816 [Agrocybe chaxingu]|uniref:F-box domain-containing protein n=1 Tax=Agrocybe chaxingu TaxID=84603 RepID=A0A9W8MQG0_9AGAR|nr:hypothetical protein NLJ89_g8816 [Agrocybe chaxingu]
MDTQLPQELFDNIIDHLHDDHISLRTCALVSSAWLHRVRTHIFNRVTLDWHKSLGGRGTGFSFFARSPQPSLAKRLLAIIKVNYTQTQKDNRLGGVASSIKELYLCEGTGTREWLAQDPSLPILLQELPNIRKFEVRRSAASVYIKWKGLPLALKDAIQGNVLASTTLTELKIGSLLFEGLNDVLYLLGACRGLRVLEVDHIGFEDEQVAILDGDGLKLHGEEVPYRVVEPTSLDRLVIGPRTSPAFISCLLHRASTIDIGTVRTLALSISGDFKDFARLLHATHALEELEIALVHDGTSSLHIFVPAHLQPHFTVYLKEYWSLPPSDKFYLSKVPRLRKFKVAVDVLQQMDDPLPWLCAVLRTGVDPASPCTRNRIKNVSVTYAIYLPAPYMDRSINTTIFEGWREIDDVLGGGGQEQHPYEELESVRLDFVLENPIGFGIAPRFLKELVLDSPRLREKGLLSIRAYDTSK